MGRELRREAWAGEGVWKLSIDGESSWVGRGAPGAWCHPCRDGSSVQSHGDAPGGGWRGSDGLPWARVGAAELRGGRGTAGRLDFPGSGLGREGERQEPRGPRATGSLFVRGRGQGRFLG